MTNAKWAGTGDADPLLKVRPGKQLSVSTDSIAAQVIRSLERRCRDCGTVFATSKSDRGFCSPTCRATFHNRRKQRGAELYDLLMALRFDRARAQEDGAWSFLSRMASAFKAEDDRDRGGLKSWEPVAVVKARHPDLSATMVSR
jgi:hypothetical protein